MKYSDEKYDLKLSHKTTSVALHNFQYCEVYCIMLTALPYSVMLKIKTKCHYQYKENRMTYDLLSVQLKKILFNRRTELRDPGFCMKAKTNFRLR